MKKKLILGIESSCDETAAAVVQAGSQDSGVVFNVLSSVVFSQIDIHKKYGGVIPELAARNHILKILPVVNEAFIKAGVTEKNIEKIAVTCGPGLMTSLMVGVETAKALAYVWQKPLYGIDHIRGHIYTAWLGNGNDPVITKKDFPILALIVSGGHTELVLLKNETDFVVIGKTIDDAAGEAFDKTAKILDLGYPGGPEISKLALLGNEEIIKFPRPLLHAKNYNFSFSGLKTAVLYKVRDMVKTKNKLSKKQKSDICASFQAAVVDVLVQKTVRAALFNKCTKVILGGGVAANKKLREVLNTKLKEENIELIVPDFQLCTDNAVMIAVSSYFEKKPTGWEKASVNPGLSI